MIDLDVRSVGPFKVLVEVVLNESGVEVVLDDEGGEVELGVLHEDLKGVQLLLLPRLQRHL